MARHSRNSLLFVAALLATGCAAEHAVFRRAGTPCNQDWVHMPVMLTFSRLSARIDEPNHAILEEVVRALRERTDIRIVRVEGHSSYCRDELGNTAISEERAAHIASLLVEMGIPTAAIATVGYGTSQPNGSECDSPTIRRVEFSLLVCR